MTATDLVNVEVPDIGDFEDVPIIEILVSPGDTVAVDDPLLTLESDKATMDVPAPFAGVVRELHVTVGDRVAQGTLLLTLEPSGGRETPAPAEPAAPEPTGRPAPAEPASSSPRPARLTRARQFAASRGTSGSTSRPLPGLAARGGSRSRTYTSSQEGGRLGWRRPALVRLSCPAPLRSASR